MRRPIEANPATVQEAYDRLRDAWNRNGELDVKSRIAVLRTLRACLVSHADDFVRALSDDFRVRSRHESLLTEISVVVSAIDYTIPRIKKWAKPQRVWLGMPYWPASAQLIKCARGVAGVIGPSNYPLQLSMMPLVGALSAGCRTVIKPSEATPRTAELIRTIIGECISADVGSVVCGGSDIAASLSRLPLDMLLFTGSHHVGVKVAAAAASNLTPVVLELGGKSPVIIDGSADLARSARTIIRGKLMNAGQTCVAPDYVLVPHDRYDDLVEALRLAANELYPDPTSGDYSAIPSQSAIDRLDSLQTNQRTLSLFSKSLNKPLYDPKLVLSPDLGSRIMREEIFGPLLPVIRYEKPEDAVAIVRRLPPPLVIYWFGKEDDELEKIVQSTASGAVSVNETVLHAGVSAIPLGGLGASGMGRYHGRAGFDAFSYERPVFKQARWTVTHLVTPPYGAVTDRILRWLLR